MTEAAANRNTPLAPPGRGARGEGKKPLTVAIVGAGPVGLTLAAALAGGAFDLHLIDRQAPGAAASDPRALALSAGSRQLLAGLGSTGVWPAASSPITEIHVDQHAAPGQTVLRASDEGIAALGHVIRYGDLLAALTDALPSAGLTRHSGEVVALDASTTACTLRWQDGSPALTADLLIHAEGSPSDSAGVTTRPYGQTAIVAEIASREAPAGRAFEHFTPAGPLALLPLGERWSLVLTVGDTEAPALLALDDSAFIAAVQQRFSDTLQFTAVTPRHAYPLALRQRRQTIAGRQVWIGNAAQTLHPVAGQGVNLGLRDACALAETLLDWELAGAEHSRLPAALAAYAARRRADRALTVGITDGLVRMFGLPGLALPRGLGLAALDRLPAVKSRLARQLMFGVRG